MTEKLFEQNIVGGGWHPESQEDLLFGDIITIKIEGMNYDSKTMKVDGSRDMYMEGLNSKDNSIFKYIGTCKIRFENKYFELELIGEELQKITRYICGYIVEDHKISIAISETAFVLNDDALKKVKWYTSRR
jgi:hypothetical protein